MDIHVITELFIFWSTIHYECKYDYMAYLGVNINWNYFYVISYLSYNVFTMTVIYVANIKQHRNNAFFNFCYRRDDVEVERSTCVLEIGVRSPVATDLSRKNR